MSKLTRSVILSGVLLLLAGGLATPASAGVSLGFFYSNLGPYGTWAVSANYGRVWRPAIYRPGWNPYYDGHWVYTDVGWMWDSDYPWGDICYHYGTWVYDDALGWAWDPGYVWAPSWVVFRTGPGYIGWAPVLPGFQIGLSVGLDIGVGNFCFVADRDFLAPRVGAVVIPSFREREIFGRTSFIRNGLTVQNNIVVNRGPSVTEVARFTGRRIEPVRFDQVRGAAPRQFLSRDQLRVDPAQMRQGVRAAVRVSEHTPLPRANERGAVTRTPTATKTVRRPAPHATPRTRANVEPPQAQLGRNSPRAMPRQAEPRGRASNARPTMTRHVPQAHGGQASYRGPQRGMQTARRAPARGGRAPARRDGSGRR